MLEILIKHISLHSACSTTNSICGPFDDLFNSANLPKVVLLKTIALDKVWFVEPVRISFRTSLRDAHEEVDVLVVLLEYIRNHYE